MPTLRCGLLVLLTLSFASCRNEDLPNDGGSGGGRPQVGGGSASTGGGSEGVGGGEATGGGEASGGGAASGCSVDADCETVLAAAEVAPPGCASARCVATVCEFASRDDDGDGERSSRCQSPTLTISTGPDCNDAPGAGARINTAAVEQCDETMTDDNCNGMVDEGCACPVPGAQTACCTGRGQQTCELLDGGGTALSMCDAPIVGELCNGLDDDCNGTVDDSPQLNLPVDAGLPIDGGVLVGGGMCVAGRGACARTGAAVCTGGAIVCPVQPGAPVAETCNGRDDDCDGQLDESVTCPVTGQSCVGGSCVCPQGQVACGSSCVTLGGSCTAGAGACARTGAYVCVAGARVCNAVAATPSVSCYADGDNDRYQTTNATTLMCADTSRPTFGNCPVGFVSTTAAVGLDCASTDPTLFRLANVHDDFDNDGRCTSSYLPNQCVGANPPAGKKFNCSAPFDCNDTSAAAWQFLAGKLDQDGDTFCQSGLYQVCTGNTLPGGYRDPNTCYGGAQGYPDCKDNNPWATTTCSIVDGYLTESASKSCGIGPPPCESFNVNVAQGCPTGFHPENYVAGLNAPSTCAVLSPTSVNSCCGGIVFGTASCRIRATCVAD